MELSKLFLNSLSVKTDMTSNLVDNQSKSSVRSSKSFDSHLENSKRDYLSNKRRSGVRDNKSSDVQRKKSVVQEISQDSTQKVKQQPVVKKTADAPNVISEESDYAKVEEQIVEEISVVLDIPVEQIVEIMNQLNLNAVDLLNVENLNQFVQLLFQVDDPVQLLTKPNVSETYEAINSVLDNYKGVDFSNVTVERLPLQDIVAAVTEDTLLNKVMSYDSVDAEMDEFVDVIPTEIVPVQEELGGDSNNNGGQNEMTGSNSFENASQLVFPVASTDTVTEHFVQALTSSDGSVEIEKVVTTKNSPSSASSSTNIIEQIVQRIKIDFKPGITEMNLSLKPEELGRLQLKISTENGVVTAQFTAETQRIKEIIESNFNLLRQMLGEQGINVSKLSVNVNADSSEGKMNQFLQSQQKSKRRIGQLLNEIDDSVALEDDELLVDVNYANPYDVLDNNVDYSA